MQLGSPTGPRPATRGQEQHRSNRRQQSPHARIVVPLGGLSPIDPGGGGGMTNGSRLWVVTRLS